MKIKPYLFIAPALLVFIIFNIYPLFSMINLSFYRWNLISPNVIFAGLGNYLSLFADPVFYKVLKNTGIYTVCTVGFSILFAMLLAVYLNNKSKVSIFLQSIIFLPYVVSLASVAFLWMWMMNSDLGLLNYIFSFVGIDKIDWLGNPHIAMFSLSLISIWKTVGYNTLIILAAMQVIPPYLYEAAALDNASVYKTFTKITFPMISPTLFFLVIVDIIASFKVFETIQIITRGGPQNATNTLVYYIYEQGFHFYKIGEASTIAVVLLVIIGLFTILYFKSLANKIHYC